jgi:peptidoglycan-associated lipoprotein
MKKIVMLLCILFLVFSCSKKRVESLDDTVTKTEQGMEDATGQYESDESDRYGRAKEEDIEEGDLVGKEAREGSRIEGEDEEYYGDSSKSPFEDIYFSYDKYDISEKAASALESVADWMNKHRDATVLIEGHCDTRGTNEYNLALGERRARAVKDYLSFSGIGKDRLTTVSYGEEKQVCSEQDESCYSKNRRAHIVLSQ